MRRKLARSEAETSPPAPLGVNPRPTARAGSLRAGVLGEDGGFDKREQKKFKRTVPRGLIFFRRVNGISLSGAGESCGARVEFGNDAKIKELAISWPSLKPHHAAAVADPEQIIQRIKDGKAVIRFPDACTPDTPIKKLTITKVTPQYLASSDERPQKYLYPYAILTATADTGSTNVVVAINCPILK